MRDLHALELTRDISNVHGHNLQSGSSTDILNIALEYYPSESTAVDECAASMCWDSRDEVKNKLDLRGAVKNMCCFTTHLNSMCCTTPLYSFLAALSSSAALGVCDCSQNNMLVLRYRVEVTSKGLDIAADIFFTAPLNSALSSSSRIDMLVLLCRENVTSSYPTLQKCEAVPRRARIQGS